MVSLCTQFSRLSLATHATRQVHTLRQSCQVQKGRAEESLKASRCLARGERLEDLLVRNRLAQKEESLFDVFHRSTKFLAQAGEKFVGSAKSEEERIRFLELVCSFKLILGSPILTNAGRSESKSISACSIPPVKLSKMSRNEIAKVVGSYHTRGMGTGFSLDDLADPVEMVKYLNEIAINEVQTGKIERSCGNMGVLSVDHPQVLSFIRVKRDNPQIKEWKFNLSVNLTDAFMAALEENEPLAVELVNQICDSAHATGDPGIVFMDRINKQNKVPQCGEYKTVVPCGEVSLFAGEVCQFSYLNLPQFVKGNGIDREELSKAVHSAVRLLDNAVEANIQRMPNEESCERIRSLRRIGVGVCGFAEVLQLLGLPYDSSQARDVASCVMSLVQFESKKASIELAKERGPFPLFDHPKTQKGLFLQPYKARMARFVSKADWQSLELQFAAHKIRNLSTTILPPSGRSSLIAGVTASIEPPFRLAATPLVRGALARHLACHLARHAGRDDLRDDLRDELRDELRNGLEQVFEEINRQGTIRHAALPDSIKAIFKTALEILPEDHLRMTQAFQEHIDEGISKTVNLPKEATVEDVRRVFISAHALALKGITIYRNGSRDLQPKSLPTTQGMNMTLHDHIYGTFTISARIANLLNSKLLLRLKQVHQNGTNFLVDPRQSTSRFEHSVGTMALTQLLGGDEQVQIAALLHDISHTAFSHVIDLVFANSKQNYHDLMREKFLSSKEAQEALKEITPQELASHTVAMVKGEGLNVDRLDYAIRDLLRVNRIYHPEYSSILNNLVVDREGKIRCKDIASGRLIFNKFLEANREIYFEPKAEVAAIAMAAILQAMLGQKLITEEDLFTTDDALIEKVLQSPYKNVFENIGPDMEYRISSTPTKHASLRKLRYVDPEILSLPGRLSDHCSQSKAHLASYRSTTPQQVYYQIPLLEGIK